MSHPYTDVFGFPLSATQVARRLNSPRSSGYYDADGRWVKRKPKAVRKPTDTPPKRKES